MYDVMYVMWWGVRYGMCVVCVSYLRLHVSYHNGQEGV